MHHFTIERVQCVVHFLMKYYSQSRSLSIWHEKMGVQEAIFVDELSGRDQMGQKKPFFKKIWGSHQKASKGHVSRELLKSLD